MIETRKMKQGSFRMSVYTFCGGPVWQERRQMAQSLEKARNSRQLAWNFSLNFARGFIARTEREAALGKGRLDWLRIGGTKASIMLCTDCPKSISASPR
jgi:hypothetical protein